MAESNHLKVVMRGADAITKWRSAHPGVRLDLVAADLSGIDLAGANLVRANLSRADLSGSNLAGVDFSWADLSETDLHGANFDKTLLRGATMHGAVVSVGADMRTVGGDFRGVEWVDEINHAK